MGLPDRPDAPARVLLAGSGQCGADFSGVMGIIIDDGYLTDFTGDLEAAADAAEGDKGFLKLGDGDILAMSDGDGGEGVADVVITRDAETEEAKHLLGAVGFEAGEEEIGAAEGVGSNVSGVVVVVGRVGIGVEAIGIGDQVGGKWLVEELLDAGVVVAGDEMAVGGEELDKAMESVLVALGGGEDIGVVMFDVGDDGGLGAEAEEHMVIFVRFDDKVGALAGTAINAPAREDATDDNGRVLVGGDKNFGEEASGGGFAVGAGDSEAVGVSHEVAEEAVSFIDGEILGERGLVFGIGSGDG